MPRFFINSSGIGNDNTITVCGEDALHISRSLRMREGENVTVCDSDRKEYDCEILKICDGKVILAVKGFKISQNEPSVKVSIFQALPKNTKLEFVIQKCIELGAFEINPIITSRCISRPDERSSENKLKRWNLIAQEAAKQSGRGYIPKICEIVSFSEAVEKMKNFDIRFMCYEEASKTNGIDIKSFMQSNNIINNFTVAFMVGPEGGFSSSEAEYAKMNGITPVSLGSRILRAETAPICVMSCIMYATDNLK